MKKVCRAGFVNFRFFSVFQHTSSPVTFFIDNLDPLATYRMIIFAVNAKGRSEPIIIDDINFKGVAKYTGKYSISDNDKPLFIFLWNKGLQLYIICLVKI